MAAVPSKLVPIDWTGENPPRFLGSVPNHVAIVMDGNGRWANKRGLPRVEGHKVGEQALLDVVAGAIQAGVKVLSVYAFSTENWKRSPDEVKFLMGFNRQVLRTRREQLNNWNVQVRWSGRRPKLWPSVINELENTEEYTANNSGLVLNMCVNYGGRNEITDAVQRLMSDVKRSKISPSRVTEQMITKYFYNPDLPDIDLFLRSSGEQRISNFMIWQASYAEMVFLDTLWPDFRRKHLWQALETYLQRERRFGAAADKYSDLPDTAVNNYQAE